MVYCIKCGVKLADTERKCPLCLTAVYHPEVEQPQSSPLYPGEKMPRTRSGKRALSGLLILLFMIPLLICLFSDLQPDGQLNWFGYVLGGLAVAYTVFALPVWFQKPNPVIFAPCDFAAIALYLLYIQLTTGGDWFLGFGLPVTAGAAVIICTVVTLVHYVGRGKLYIYGGAVIALGALILLVEILLGKTLQIPFIGWSVYPLVVLVMLGGGLIYLAINSTAREMIERKLFF